MTIQTFAKKFAKYMPMASFPEKRGSALQIGISEYQRENKSTKTVVMLEMVHQSKPKPPTGSTESGFDWAKDKIFMSLKDLEIAGIIGVIIGIKDELKVIHKHPIDGPEEQQKSSTLEVRMNDFRGTKNLLIKMGQKKPGSTEYTSVQIALQPEDFIVLRLILEGAIKKIYGV